MPLTDNGADADHLKRRIDFHGLLLPTLVLCREFCDLSSTVGYFMPPSSATQQASSYYVVESHGPVMVHVRRVRIQ